MHRHALNLLAEDLGQEAKVGVLCNSWFTELSARPLLDIGNVVIVRTPTDHASLEARAMELIAAGCTRLVSWNLVTGTDKQISPGDLLLPTQVIDTEFEQRYRSLVGESRKDRSVLISTRYTSDAPLRRRVGMRFQSHAVDVQSAVIARIADRHRVGFTAVAGVSSYFTDRWIDRSLRLLDTTGRIRVGRCLAMVILSPRSAYLATRGLLLGLGALRDASNFIGRGIPV